MAIDSVAAPPKITGLTSAEAADRAAKGQANLVAWQSSRSMARIFFDNAASPINIALFAIAIALLALQLYGDAFLTGTLVLGNVVVGVFQEVRAKRQLDRIALLNRPQAVVIRDGEEKTVPPDQIVLGDAIVLSPGDQVLADGALLSASGLGLDESLLTGESDILPKKPGDDVVSGSYCMTGSGVYEATRVGADTVANKITERAREHRVPTTPLQREVVLVLWAMSLVVVFLSVFVIRSFLQSDDVGLRDAVRAAAVIVALVPQGLAVMVTVSYAMAAVRMAGTGVLIQRMNAVESISHVDTLCLDKTGTLTTNRLTFETLRPFDIDEAQFKKLLGAFAASASFSNRTADAIKEAFPEGPRPFNDEVAFDSSRKWSGIVFDDGAYVLGAPEIVGRATERAGEIASASEEWAERGLRVLLLARAPASAFDRSGEVPALPDGLTPLGLVVLRDETREDAPEVIAEFAATGIDLKVISGDHPDTVAALASQAGMPISGEPANGVELETMADEELDTIVKQTAIFGRVTPRTKERLVHALRRSGRYVAMIGDGVNDVPALKAGHVAVALRSGAGITRDVADMVLLNDSFSNLPRAFAEGQRIRKGMENIFRVFLTRTISLTLVILAVALLSDPFPVTPRHTALIAAVTVGIPSLFLAAWARPGKTGQLVLVSASRFVIPASLTIAALGLIAYKSFLSTTDDVELAQTALTLTAVGCGLLLLLYLEPPSPIWVAASPLTADRRPALATLGLFGLLMLLMVVPFTRNFYEIYVPNIWQFAIIALTVAAWAWLIRAIWRVDLPPPIRSRFHSLAARLRPHITRTN
jgi:cation-transporting ATPase E